MKNFDFVETLDKDRHAKLKVKPNPDMGHAKDQNILSVTMNEFGVICASYPVVFIEQGGPDNLHPVAMAGLGPGENLYYGEKLWESTYLPLSVLRHPFIIGYDDRLAESEQPMLTMCLEKNSPFLSEEEGTPLFNENGEDSDYLNNMKQILSQIFDGERLTEQFVGKLKELDLIAPFELIVQVKDQEPKRITGMFSINEEKLKTLTPEQLKDLNDSNFLQAAHFMLGSLFQIHRLIRMRNQKRSDEEIVQYQIKLNGTTANH